MGVHISFVRSVSMDSWNEKQISLMRNGGNNKSNAFLAQYNVNKNTQIPQKYNSPAATLYKDRLLAIIEGRPLPTELPKPVTSTTQGSTQGTEPLPGESEADYVIRQKQLQNEARERLRQKFGSPSGLGSGGRMQGIGSDSSYQPQSAASSSSSTLTAEEIAAQLAQASQQTLNYVSSLWGPNVADNKGAETATSDRNSAAAPEANPVGVWGSYLASGAADLWTKASEATAEIVQSISKPDEEEFKFPRRFEPPSKSLTTSATSAKSVSDIPRSNSGSSMGKAGSSNDSLDSLSAYSNGANTSSKTMGSNSNKTIKKKSISDDFENWDDLDIDDLNVIDAPPPPAPSSRRSVDQGPNTPTTAKKISSTSLQTTDASVGLIVTKPTGGGGGGSLKLTSSTSTSTAPVPTRPSLQRTSSSSSQPKPAAAPVGDDFFNTFGI